MGKYSILLIHSSVDGYMDCFHFLAIMNNAVMNTDVQAFCVDIVLISLGYIPSSVQLLSRV